MTNKAQFAFVIISSALLAACTTQAPKTQGTTPETANGNSEQTLSTSVRDLFGAGKSVKCTFSTSDTDKDGVKTDTSGTVYVSGKNFAEDTQVVSSDKKVGTITMKMISDGTYMYTWNPSQKTPGMKINITTPTPTGTTQGQAQSADVDKKIDMKCSSWTVDNSLFSVPDDVQFIELSQMMQGAGAKVPSNIPSIPAMPSGVPAGDE